MSTITVNGRHVAEFVANKVQPIAIPSERFRPDVGNIQVDFGHIDQGVTIRIPIVRLQFESLGNRGVELNIRLPDFAADPDGYTRDLMDHLGPMLRNVMKLREKKRNFNASIGRFMTEGAHV